MWVVLGCGYVGERLAARLAAGGERVIATTRRADRAAELVARGIETRVADGYDWIPDDAIVVDSIPTPHPPPPYGRRTIYLGSTGVYPRGDGGWVDEDTPVGPDGERGRARLAHERALRDAGRPFVILRIAAIYGPGRGVTERMRSGTYRIFGDGSHWVSRIHADDLVSVIVAAGSIATPPRDTYCVADDEPTTARAYADAIAAQLGLPPPPSVPVSSVTPDVAELVLTNRRVRNLRMKRDLGITLAFPHARTVTPPL